MAVKNVNEAIVAQAGEEGLLVVKGVLGDNARGGVGNARDGQVAARSQGGELDGHKGIVCAALEAENPGGSPWGEATDGFGQLASEPEAVEEVADVLGQAEAQLACGALDVAA